jgi:hypothetical protein
MSYREFLPPPPLRALVDRFWVRSDLDEPPAERPHRVLPDGCIDVVIDIEDGHAR